MKMEALEKRWINNFDEVIRSFSVKKTSLPKKKEVNKMEPKRHTISSAKKLPVAHPKVKVKSVEKIKEKKNFTDPVDYLKYHQKPIPPKSFSEVRLALEKFYDNHLELSSEECYWIYTWFNKDFRYLEELYDYLLLKHGKKA